MSQEDTMVGGASAETEQARPFDEQAVQEYRDILLRLYEERIKEELPEVLQQSAGHLLSGTCKYTDLFNDTEDEEIEAAGNKIGDLLREYQSIQDKTDILHLFISVPLNDKEHDKRVEQFEVFAGINPFVHNTGSNTVVVKITRGGSIKSIISNFVREANRYPDVNRLNIVINGHGTREGALTFAGHNQLSGAFTDPKLLELVHVDQIVADLNEFLNRDENEGWPHITLVFAQCHAHKIKDVKVSFDVQWFTSEKHPKTQNYLTLEGKWNHVELNDYGSKLPAASYYSLKSQRKEAEKWTVEVRKTNGVSEIEAGIANLLNSNESDQHQMLLLSLPVSDHERKMRSEQYVTFAKAHPDVKKVRVVTFEVERKIGLLSVISKFIEGSSESAVAERLTIVINGKGDAQGNLHLLDKDVIAPEIIIQYLLDVIKGQRADERSRLPEVTLIFGQSYGHCFDRNLISGADNALLDVVWYTTTDQPHTRNREGKDGSWHHLELEKYASEI